MDTPVSLPQTKIQALVYRLYRHQPEFLLLLPTRGNQGWSAVTGGVEQGESLEQTVIREIGEELQMLPLNITNLNYSFQFQRHWTNVDNDIVTEHGFAAEVGDDVTPVLSHEHSDYQWLSPAAAHATLANPQAKLLLNRLLDWLDQQDAS